MKVERWQSRIPYLLSRSILILSLSGFTNHVQAQIATHPVISEVYGGGGNAGAFYKNDFVELYNPTSFPVTMTHWSVQYQSASGTGSTWQKTVFSGTIPAHQFFLVQEAQGSGGTAPLPAPDAAGTISLASTGGKVALAGDTVTISGPAGANVIDFVGYGSANQFEGSLPAGALSNTTSAERKAQASSTLSSMSGGGSDSLSGNGWDGGDNRSDFVITNVQGPQNLSSPPENPPLLGDLPPVISNVARSPHVADPGGTDTVTASISDADGVVSSARISIRVDGGAFDSSVAMAPLGGTQFRGVIPSGKHGPAGTLVEYFISALDDSSKYSSTRSSPGGYFVGDAPVSAVKSHPLPDVAGYGVRVSGTLNVRTNTFANGQGFLQDASGGIGLFLAGGLPAYNAGRNVRVEGTIVSVEGAYHIGGPGFSFTDTSLGNSTIAPVTLTLPLPEASGYLNEGKLVKILALSTSSSGAFSPGTSYSYHTPGSDTITLRVESFAGLNTLSGTQIPSAPRDAVGILSYSNGFQRLKPRTASDMGNLPLLTFEAAASGNWSDTNTWSSRQVPGDSSDVTFSTPGVTVTVDLPDARCRNLTMTGSGTSLGPTLRFDQSGTPQLTINGNLSISGGSGSGQGGRSKLTSNGNGGATLVLKQGISTSTSNIIGNGSSGLNMNEGFVKLVSISSDTLRNSAGLRLGNLTVGDGVNSKVCVWSASKKTTIVLRSLIVKSHSTFWIGDAADTNSGDIGNSSANGVPTLTGGITVEPDAQLLVQQSPAGGGHGAINLDGGGITNEGTILLHTGDAAGSSYRVNIGGLPAGSASSSQSVRGSRSAGFADIEVASGHTFSIEQGFAIPDPYRLSLGGTLVELPGETVTGRVEATRLVARSAPQNFGGIGCTILADGSAPESTEVVRVTGAASGPSILRYFEIIPSVNAGLDASLDFSYDDSELNGQDPRSLRLWRSADVGATWSAPAGSIADTLSRTVRLSGIHSFSRWTASDAAHVLGNSTVEMRYSLSENWNLVSFPLSVAGRTLNSLFPGAISPAFRYDGGYLPADTLKPGTGYWCRLRSAEADTISGVAESVDSVKVSDGWNLIGSPAYPISGSQIVQVPPGIVSSNYFGYENGYVVARTLEPGKGYWVKVSGGGTLFFSAVSRAAGSVERTGSGPP
ncbi:MAG TPA: lamin tail domain-containing protein [Bacteroidota bacterium]|jgi:hypothetical protein